MFYWHHHHHAADQTSAWIPALFSFLGSLLVAAVALWSGWRASRTTLEATRLTSQGTVRAQYLLKQRNTLQWVADRFTEVHFRSLSRSRVLNSKIWTADEESAAAEDFMRLHALAATARIYRAPELETAFNAYLDDADTMQAAADATQLSTARHECRTQYLKILDLIATILEQAK